jgi:penicillin amidase
VIEVKNSPSLRRKIYRTAQGPIITKIGGGQAQVALKWYKNVNDNPFHSFYLMNQAASVKDIFKAGANLGMIAINLVAADVEGNIGWHAAGNIPIRSGYSGCWPVDGCQSRFQWKGFIPYSELPSSFNPPEGFIATANEDRREKNYPYDISFSWAAPYRAQRIKELLREKEKLDRDDFQRIQNDQYSLRAERIISFIRDLEPESEPAAQALEILKKWDRNVNVESGEAALYELFLTSLISNLVKDELGENLYFYFVNMYKSLIVDELSSHSGSPLWDRIDTPQKETWREIVEMSLAEALKEAEKRMGRDRNEWQWGKLHKIFYRHPGAESWITRKLMNYGPYSLGGDNITVNYAGFNPVQGKYDVTTIPSFRMIVDMTDLGKTLIIGPMGQSGQPQHPHYHDMIDLWRNGQYIPMYFHKKDVTANHTELLVLK